MPSPVVFRIPIRYPYKRTYCGSLMEYDPELSDSHSSPPPNEQNAEDGAGQDEKEPGSPGVVPAAAVEDVEPYHPIVASYEPVSPSYVWVAREDGKEDKAIGRTGSASPIPAASTSPAHSPTFADKKKLYGKTYYPVKTEDGECTPSASPTKTDRMKRSPSVSPRIGRTKGGRLGRNLSEAFSAPDGELKLEPFSPKRSKTDAREDSVSSDEGPAKRSKTGAREEPLSLEEEHAAGLRGKKGHAAEA